MEGLEKYTSEYIREIPFTQVSKPEKCILHEADYGLLRYAGMDFEAALRKYADCITRLCLVNTGNQEDAKDCFQNIFLKLYLSHKEFSDEEYLKAWLIRVAINECRDLHRTFWKRKVDIGYQEITKEELSGKRTVNGEERVIYKEECQELMESLRLLPEKYREVLYLYYYESFDTGEIAKMLNLRVNTVKSRLLRGRKKLGERMGAK